MKEKEAYQCWTALHRNFPRVERLGIGARTESLFLDVLELTFASAYLPPEHKIPVLAKAIAKTDLLKFFLQLAWESRLIPDEPYVPLSGRLEEIGRILGGWRRGCISKTPPPQAKEKRATVSEEHSVASVPPVRIRNGVGVEVPTPVVPVHLHDATNRPSSCEKAVHAPPPEPRRAESNAGPQSPLTFRTNS